MQPTIGRIVSFKISQEEIRPAIIVRVWSDTCVQLQIFIDGTNDRNKGFNIEEQLRGIAWRTSVVQGDDPGQWQWPKIN